MINMHIHSEFLDFIGLTQLELEEVFNNSKDEREFIKHLWIEECIEQLDLNSEKLLEFRDEILNIVHKQYELLWVKKL